MNIILLLGIGNMMLILFQLLSGLRIIKVTPKIHKKTGITLVVFAVAHAALAILANS